MAKKKEALTPEQRLQEALVPCTEWPYKIPANWCWTYLENICALSNGKATNAGNLPYLEAKYLRGKTGPTYKENGKFVRKGSKVILVDGENSGEVFNIDENGYMGSTFRLLTSSETINDTYLEHFFSIYQEKFRSSKTGSAIPHLNKDLFRTLAFPIAPAPEQQRIVDQIESLFAKLDEAKEKAQAALDSFEPRKAAILHKAFTGELTAQWRKENGIGLESWERTTLGNQCRSIFDGDHMPPPKSETGIPFLVISNVNTGHLSFENTRFVSEEYYQSLSDTRRPELNDVLYTLVGSYGIPVIVDSEQPFCFQRHMALLKPKDIDTKYLWYLLQTEEMYRKATDIATGTAQQTVPIKGFRNMEFTCASKAEQLQIVRILDSLLAKEQQAKEAAEAVLEQIVLIKKSVLSRAFRGELGTNDPTEEDSIELLKEIIMKEA